MSDPHDTWNPEDGPPPTAEELSDAAALARALDARPAHGRPEDRDSDLDALVSAALRVRATAHPDEAAARAVAQRSVTDALARARAPWLRGRWRWLAAAAVLVAAGGVGGLELFRGTPSHPWSSVSQPTSDVFRTAVSPGAGSGPSQRLYDARLRTYRDNLLLGRRPR